MKKSVNKLLSIIVVLTVLATHFYKESSFELERIAYEKKISNERDTAKKEGKKEAYTYFEEVVLPAAVEKAFRGGERHCDSIYQAMLPGLLAETDSIGFLNGWSDAEIYFEKKIIDTLQKVYMEMELYGQYQYSLGYDQRITDENNERKAKIEAAKKVWTSNLKQVLQEDDSRMAVGIFCFCLGIMLVHTIKLRLTRPRRRLFH